MRGSKLLTLSLIFSATVAGLGLAAPAAFAADTVATFSLTGAANAITMSVPDGSTTPVAIGSATAGSTTVSGSLGSITVTDSRAALVTSWTVSVASTAFTLVGGSSSVASQTVPTTSITYASGAATATGAGTGTFTPLAATALGTPQQAGAFAGSGSKTVTWNPTMVFTLLSGQIAGTYQGTVTHSLTTVS